MDFYDLKANRIDGTPFLFKTLQGKKVLIVNVASECGFTSQYSALQELFTAHPDLEILGFPCNDFGGQEPGSEDEIKQFCSLNFGVTFTMMEKVKVKGEEKHAVFKWIDNAARNAELESEVTWNFHKIAVSEAGDMVANFPSSTSPVGEEILQWVND